MTSTHKEYIEGSKIAQVDYQTRRLFSSLGMQSEFKPPASIKQLTFVLPI